MEEEEVPQAEEEEVLQDEEETHQEEEILTNPLKEMENQWAHYQ